MKLQMTYKYRLYPTQAQQEQIKKTCDCVRYVYNKLLEDRTKHYKRTGKWKKLDVQQLDKQPFMVGIDPGALLWAQNSLETAYRNFFYTERNIPDRYRPESIRKAKYNNSYNITDVDLISYPRFKKKKTSKESYTTPLKELEVKNNRIHLPCVGDVKIRYHRDIPQNAELLSGTVRKNSSGQYYLLVRFLLPEVAKVTESKNPIGIVFEPGKLAVRSDDVSVNYRHQDEQLQKRMDMAYKTLKRRKPGSKRYEKQREYLASLYEHRANQRKDDLHKAARQITNVGDCFYMQKPDVRKQLSAIEDDDARTVLLDEATWTFSYFLKYKAQNEGKLFKTIPREVPIFSTCSGCNSNVNEEPQENWCCPECGAKFDAYLNAAVNLRNMAAAVW